MNRDLDDLLALTGRLVPGLSGQVAAAPGPGIRPGADNAQAIARLRDGLGAALSGGRATLPGFALLGGC